MHLQKGFRLRSTVNAIVTLTVLATMAISSFIAYSSEKQSLTHTTFQLNQVYADKISDTVNAVFANMKHGLAITGEYLAKDLSRPDLQDYLELFQKSNSSFNSVFIIGKDGKLVESSNPAVKRGSLIASDGTKQALEQKRSLISEPYISAATNKLIVMISEPLYDSEGRYSGFIGGSIWLHETNIFQTILGSAPNESDGSYAYVVSSKGILLYHPDSSRIGEKVEGNPVIDHVAAGLNGMERVVNSQGVDMLASYAYIREAGWGIVAQTPTEVVLTVASKLVLRIMLYMFPALLIFLIAIYWIIRKLSDPLVKLASFASMLSPNNSGRDELPKIHSLNYEANELHKAFGRAVRHFRYQFDNLSQEAQTDPLTGLNNRRTMDKYIKDWISMSRPFSLIILDLDHFKLVNDTFGHDVGDEVLKFLANNLRRLFNEDYKCCRMGGEEFVILVPNESIEVALHEAERIRKYMAETDSPTGGKVTLSIGVAHYPGFASNAEQLFRIADEALYRAKHQGRNRVEAAQALSPQEMTI
ncbi:sensor domain-containing diguanylate cyclase [Cohnella terricola]|nr:sensor domain-containing diguanylate cyclase [Cohnella terricola]